MKSKIIITLAVFVGLLLSNFRSSAQQQFTKIPLVDTGARVYVVNVAEINNEYFFYSWQSYKVNGIDTGASTIHKTDLNGTIKDSLMLPYGDSTLSFSVMRSKNNQIHLYGMSGAPDSGYHIPDFSLSHKRFDINLNPIDSFLVAVPQTSAKAHYLLLVREYADKIYYVVRVADTTIASWSPYQDRIYVTDTLGNFLFEKKLRSHAYVIDDLISTNNGESFITLSLGMYCRLDSNLNVVDSTQVPSSGLHLKILDAYSSSKFTHSYIKSYINSSWVTTDTIHTDLLDTNFAVLAHRNVLRDTFLHTILNSIVSPSKLYDGQIINNINCVTNWRDTDFVNTLFSVTNMDSNLNVRWTKTFGGSFYYQIIRCISTTDGGCLLLGNRNNEYVIYKLNSQGTITNLTSLSPSAQKYFSLFPNPNNGISYLRNSSDKKYDLFVFSQEGKAVFKKESIATETTQIDLSHLPSGIYFYQAVTQEGKSAVGKIVKE